MGNLFLLIIVTLITIALAIVLSKIIGGGSAGATTNKDFLLGGANLGAIVAAGTLCATYWSGHAFVGSVGTAYAYGYTQLLAGAGYIPPMVIACVFLARFMKKKADKMGALSVTEYAGRIHDSAAVHFIGALANVCLMFVSLLTQFKALGRLLEPILNINGNIIVLIIGAICVAYTVFGGLKTIAYSDMIMAIGMTIGAIFCVVTVFNNTSLAELTSNLRAIDVELTNPTTGVPYGQSVIGPFLIIVYAAIGLMSTPYTATRFLAVKKDVKWWKFAFWCVIFAGAWEVLPFVGNFVRSTGVQLDTADSAMGYFLSHYVGKGMMAIIAVFIMMAIRSTIDSVLQSISGSISYDMRYALTKGKSADDVQKSMRINRIVVAVVGVLGIAFNWLTQPSFLVFMGTLGTGTLEAIMCGPMFISTFWQGNKYGAIASMIGGGVFTAWALLSETLMWTTAPVVGCIIAAALYFGVSAATFKICPRAEMSSVITH